MSQQCNPFYQETNTPMIQTEITIQNKINSYLGQRTHKQTRKLLRIEEKKQSC